MGLFRRIEEHGTLMRRMMRLTGVNLAQIDGYGGESALRNAIVRCIGCSNGEECRAWAAKAEQGSPPPAFCRNAELFTALAEPDQ